MIFSTVEAIKKQVFLELIEEFKKIIPKTNDGELMTTEQVCKLFQKIKSTIWRWTRDEVLIGYRMNGTVYYKKSEIYDTIHKNKIQS